MESKAVVGDNSGLGSNAHYASSGGENEGLKAQRHVVEKNQGGVGKLEGGSEEKDACP